MSRKYLHAIWVALLHLAVLAWSHQAAELARETAGLIRDELALDATLALWR